MNVKFCSVETKICSVKTKTEEQTTMINPSLVNKKAEIIALMKNMVSKLFDVSTLLGTSPHFTGHLF